jgi:hypothetical protein
LRGMAFGSSSLKRLPSKKISEADLSCLDV